jgi:hypothetical protein
MAAKKDVRLEVDVPPGLRAIDADATRSVGAVQPGENAVKFSPAERVIVARARSSSSRDGRIGSACAARRPRQRLSR